MELNTSDDLEFVKQAKKDEGWQVEFERDWNSGCLSWNGNPENEPGFQRVMTRIASLLEKQREELAKEVEGLKKDDGRKPHELYGQSLSAPSHIDTYNIAISNAAAIIRKCV